MAVLLTEAYLTSGKKSDQLLDLLPQDCQSEVRARTQSLFLGALRNGHRIQDAAKSLFRKPPREGLRAILLVTGYELLHEEKATQPKIVHHAVERSKGLTKKHEQGFLNAVLRQLGKALEAQEKDTNESILYSHPAWLVDHWAATFGPESTKELLKWNQQIPQLYLKSSSAPNSQQSCLSATDWESFYKIDNKANWQTELAPLLSAGEAYIKDPSTRIAPKLLAPQSGETVLDLCAAPGGKAYEMANSMQRNGRIVAVDLPGDRIPRLAENLDRITGEALMTSILEADITELSKELFEAKNLPFEYDAIMLDAPCSNTGVIQRRTDVKWRLRENDIENCAKLQQQLIHSAARFVKPDGRLVYSTCSIEPVENKQLIDTFLKSKSGQAFELEAHEIALPWECGHDGASAFLLRKQG